MLAPRTVLALGMCLILQATAQQLIWEDNFDTLDEQKWSHLITGWDGGNQEFQYYRNNRKNSYVEDGVLFIKPTPASDELSDWDMRYGIQYDSDCNMEPCIVYADPEGNTLKPVFSARLHTQETLAVSHGRVEIRAKFPRGDWIWPSIWMLPVNNTYGPWPISGEIDIMDGKGNANLTDAFGGFEGIQASGLGLYFQEDENSTGFSGGQFVKTQGDFADDFTLYAVEWTNMSLTIHVGESSVSWEFIENGWWAGEPSNNPYINGTVMAPFDEPFYLILNVAVGGNTFLPEYINENGKPWDLESGRPWAQFYEAQPQILATWEEPALQIDYVRVYELDP